LCVPPLCQFTRNGWVRAVLFIPSSPEASVSPPRTPTAVWSPQFRPFFFHYPPVTRLFFASPGFPNFRCGSAQGIFFYLLVSGIFLLAPLPLHFVPLRVFFLCGLSLPLLPYPCPGACRCSSVCPCPPPHGLPLLSPCQVLGGISRAPPVLPHLLFFTVSVLRSHQNPQLFVPFLWWSWFCLGAAPTRTRRDRLNCFFPWF